MNRLNKIIFVFACIVFALSCTMERDPCLQPLNVYANIEFKRVLNDTTAIDTSFGNILLGPLDTTPVVYNGKNVKRASVSFSPHADKCSWFFQPDSAHFEKRDTIIFYYQRQLHFINNACGYNYFFTIDSVRGTFRTLADTLHTIDSVIVLNNAVNSDATKTQLRFYFHKK